MTLLIAIFGGLVLIIGAAGVIFPEKLMNAIAEWRSPTRLYTAVGMRLILGIILILAAPECRFPLAIRVLGGVAIVAAVVLFLLGEERFNAFVDWWAAKPASVIRFWCVFALAFGGFLVYAAL